MFGSSRAPDDITIRILEDAETHTHTYTHPWLREKETFLHL